VKWRATIITAGVICAVAAGVERQAAMAGKLHEVHDRLTAKTAAAHGGSGPGAPTDQAARNGGTQTSAGTPDVTGNPAREVKSR
jgi:hypothetical protein